MDGQASDEFGSPSDPPDTTASIDGSDIRSTSAPSCHAIWFCATGSLALSIDTVAPSLAPAISPATVLLHGSATATPHASDGTSGIATQGCGSVDTSIAGNYALDCTATDAAGNTTTVSVPYLVQYRILRFLSPGEKPTRHA